MSRKRTSKPFIIFKHLKKAPSNIIHNYIAKIDHKKIAINLTIKIQEQIIIENAEK